MNDPATWNPLGLTWLQYILIVVGFLAVGLIITWIQRRRGR